MVFEQCVYVIRFTEKVLLACTSYNAVNVTYFLLSLGEKVFLVPREQSRAGWKKLVARLYVYIRTNFLRVFI